MAQKLANKIVLITGASEGIGYATAELFVQEGAFVYITGRSQEKLDAAVKALGGGSKVCAIKNDASDIKGFDAIHDQILKEKGHLDILFANAGYIELAPIGAISEAAFDKLFDTNVKGVLFLVQKMLPLFGKNGGSIILNGSVASIKAPPTQGTYCATKAAVRSFARCWSVDLKGRNIRVNVVSPGAIDTPMLQSAFKDDQEMRKQFIAHLEGATVLGRIGRADEVAKAALFLASDDSSYITGIELFVDGGTGQI